MPRLDETSVETTNRLEEIEIDWETIVHLQGSSIDLCWACYNNFGFVDNVEHPPYQEVGETRYCVYCGDELTEDDN